MKKSQNDMRQAIFQRKPGIASLASAFILLATATGGMLTACKGGSEVAEKTPPASAAPAPEPSAPAAPPSGPPNPPAPTQPASSLPDPATITAAGKMDFSLSLKPISDPSKGFSGFRGRQVLLFYFGPTCPHCQQALPQVQDFADQIRIRGVETIAIANQRSNNEEIREFMSKYRVRMPVFWDAERKFGEAYDVKMLPTLYLVGLGGDTFRLDNFSGKASLDSLMSRI
jgi:peroxiredoxin